MEFVTRKQCSKTSATRLLDILDVPYEKGGLSPSALSNFSTGRPLSDTNLSIIHENPGEILWRQSVARSFDNLMFSSPCKNTVRLLTASEIRQKYQLFGLVEMYKVLLELCHLEELDEKIEQKDQSYHPKNLSDDIPEKALKEIDEFEIFIKDFMTKNAMGS